MSVTVKGLLFRHEKAFCGYKQKSEGFFFYLNGQKIWIKKFYKGKCIPSEYRLFSWCQLGKSKLKVTILIAFRIIKIKGLITPSVGMHEKQRQILNTAYHVYVDRNTLKNSISVDVKMCVC